MVAVTEQPTDQPRTTTLSQDTDLLQRHARLVEDNFRRHDKRLKAALVDWTPLWTEDVVGLLGLSDNRVRVLFGNGSRHADQGIDFDPGSLIADTTGTRDGNRVRGITRGRLSLWALWTRRAVWHPETGQLIWGSIAGISSTPGIIARAAAALRNPAVPASYRDVLEARINYPNWSTSQIAKHLGMTKPTFTSKLHRAFRIHDNNG